MTKKLGLWEAQEVTQKLHCVWWTMRIAYFPKSALNEFNIFVIRLSKLHSEADRETQIYSLAKAANELINKLQKEKQSELKGKIAMFAIGGKTLYKSSGDHPYDDLVIAIETLFNALGSPLTSVSVPAQYDL